MTNSIVNQKDVASFRKHLAKSNRIVALLGAGLSASSGLPTFRGAGGLWRTHDAISLATPEAFEHDPGLVWQFYSYRRHMALNANPNPAHMALAALSKKKPDFMTISQNVDGLSPRAGHPASQLKLVHGNLYDVKCWNEEGCGYIRTNDFTDPIVPSLAIPQATIEQEKKLQTGQHDSQTDSSTNPLVRGIDISNADNPLASVPPSDLPQCPQCSTQLLRPGVVWFGESLPENVLNDIDSYFASDEDIDLMLVIGTSSTVFPAAAYTEMASQRGARVAVINLDPDSGDGLDSKDWFFCADAAVVIPELFRDEVEIEEFKG